MVELFDAIGFWAALSWLILPAPLLALCLYLDTLISTLKAKGIPPQNLPCLLRWFDQLEDTGIAVAILWCVSAVINIAFFIGAIFDNIKLNVSFVEFYAHHASRASGLGGVVIALLTLGVSMYLMHKLLVFVFVTDYKISKK